MHASMVGYPVDNISTYRLTILACIVVIVLSAGVVLIFGGPDEGKQYLALIGAIAIPALLSLFKSEQNSQSIQQSNATHDDVRAMVASLVDRENVEHGNAAGAGNELPVK